MKIPKRIDTLIDKRLLLAERLNSIDIEICEWMESKGMDLSDMGDFTRTGCMIYCEPVEAANCLINAIEEFEVMPS